MIKKLSAELVFRTTDYLLSKFSRKNISERKY
jgi:hypothetical protein